MRAPTLLIAGDRDRRFVDLNNEALVHLRNADTRLRVIPGATHLFEEPAWLEEVGVLAREWFRARLDAPVLAGAAG